MRPEQIASLSNSSVQTLSYLSAAAGIKKRSGHTGNDYLRQIVPMCPKVGEFSRIQQLRDLVAAH